MTIIRFLKIRAPGVSEMLSLFQLLDLTSSSLGAIPALHRVFPFRR